MLTATCNPIKTTTPDKKTKMLLYKAEVQEITKNGFTCPPTSATESTRTAYRWVFNPITERCFLPQALRNPPRLLSEKDPEKKCSCWGVSMHDTLNQSISAFHAVEKSYRGARKTLGDHVAQGTLVQADGLSTPSNNYGHFDLHPYKSAKPVGKFTVIAPIP